MIKMLVLLLTVACLQVSAVGHSQNTVTLSVKDGPLRDVFTLIQKQTRYRFFYHEDEDLDKIRVTMVVRNQPVETLLPEMFRNLPLSYTVNNAGLILIKKDVLKTLAPVTGIVTNEGGEPLSGVSVGKKGTTEGTTTGPDGKFSIEANPDDILVFSMVGMVAQEIIVGSEHTFNIILKRKEVDIGDDVVVVAYGRQKKATLTGAVATINTKEIKQSPAANLAVTLTGRLPGLLVQQRTGQPGYDQALLFIRGRSTTNGQSPLILVDGVERDITFLDPNEVESVSILKDASSTALFGVRGANGVILVTTKRGTSTVPRIGLTVERGEQTFTRWPSQLNAYEWAQLKNEAIKNDNSTATPRFSEYALERYRLNDNPVAYPNNDWINMLMYKWVPQTRYNLTIDGATQNVNYFINVNYLNQGGQWKVDPKTLDEYDPRSFLRRMSFRSNIDAVLNRKRTLTTFLNAAGYLEKANNPNTATTEIMSRILSLWPVVQPGPLGPNGQVLTDPDNLYTASPWAYINRSGYVQETRSNVTASWGLKQDMNFFTKGLALKTMITFDTRSVNTFTGSRSYELWKQYVLPRPGQADSIYYRNVRTDIINTPLAVSTGTSFQSFYNLQLQADYNRSFNKHNVYGLFLAQEQSLIRPNGSDILPYNLRGIAGRAGYSFENKYLAEFNFGYNGSEQFAKGKRYGFFPSYSLGWTVSNEDFFKSIKPVVNFLKFRASYGVVGNDRLSSNRFLYLDDLKVGGGAGYVPGLGRGALINETYYGNPDLTWEIAKKMNIGTDIEILKQITITADYFTEKRDNILIFRGGYPIMGGLANNSLPPLNIGSIHNKGYEIELNYNKQLSNKLSILTKWNYAHAKNKVLFVDEPANIGNFVYPYRRTGFQIGELFGLVSDGFFNSQEEISQSGLIYAGYPIKPGDLKFIDQNGDKIINTADYVPLGGTDVPTDTWGAAFNVTYGNLDVSVLFQGAFNVYGSYAGAGFGGTQDFRSIHLLRWNAERYAAGEEIKFPRLTEGNNANSGYTNDFFNLNRAFTRLKTMEIGYRLPTKWVSKISAHSARIYLNGFNLFTWDKMKIKDWDPEMFSNVVYPVYKTINAGVNITF